MAIYYPVDEWNLYYDRHEKWASDRTDSDGALYCLPSDHFSVAVGLFVLDDPTVLAEDEFATLCDRHQAIGFSDRRPIGYPWLIPPPPLPCDFLEDLGWTQEDVDWVRANPEPTSHIRERTKAAIGRLISMPKFNCESIRVQAIWKALPDSIRPPLPIHRSFSTALLPEGHEWVSAPEALSEFHGVFDGFCENWQLVGMATWKLPLPCGPHWSPQLAPSELLRRGGGYLQTPWHFPAQADDGLGQLLQDEHRRQAASRGVDDEACWATYASFLRLNHWESVFRSRYEGKQRVHAFITEMESVLAEILAVSVDRIQTLRKRLRALQSGQLSSLKGRR